MHYADWPLGNPLLHHKNTPQRLYKPKLMAKQSFNGCYKYMYKQKILQLCEGWKSMSDNVYHRNFDKFQT